MVSFISRIRYIFYTITEISLLKIKYFKYVLFMCDFIPFLSLSLSLFLCLYVFSFSFFSD